MASKGAVFCPQSRARQHFAHKRAPLGLHCQGMLPQRFVLLRLQPCCVRVSENGGIACCHQYAVKLGDRESVAAAKAYECGHRIDSQLFCNGTNLMHCSIEKWFRRSIRRRGLKDVLKIEIKREMSLRRK